MGVSRRGFFGRLLGKKPFKQACFAVQVVIHADGIDDLRKQLHAIIDAPADETPRGKASAYKQLTSLLLEAEPYFEYASWAYQDDERFARDEFHQWVSEIEAGIATEARELGEDVDGYHRLDKEKRYVVLTMVFLLSRPHPWHDELDDEDDDSYTRPRLGQLIDSVNLFDFANGVEGDAMFLVPGSDQDGLSWSDLADEGWQHLKMLHSGSRVALE